MIALASPRKAVVLLLLLLLPLLPLLPLLLPLLGQPVSGHAASLRWLAEASQSGLEMRQQRIFCQKPGCSCCAAIGSPRRLQPETAAHEAVL